MEMQIGIAELNNMLYWKQVYDDEVQRLVNITRYWRSSEKETDDRKRYGKAARYDIAAHYRLQGESPTVPF